MMEFTQKLQLLYHQLQEFLFYPDYRKRKDTLETKKCRNCLKRVSLHWNICPWCKHSLFSFNEEYLYSEKSMVKYNIGNIERLDQSLVKTAAILN